MYSSVVATIFTNTCIKSGLARDLAGRKSGSAFRRKTRFVGNSVREQLPIAGMKLKKVRYSTFVAALLILALTTNTGHAQEKIEMELTVVKGNKELPKVLYIVPWKRLADGNIQQKLVLHSLFEDAFDPIEPHVFERYVDDYRNFADSQSK